MRAAEDPQIIQSFRLAGQISLFRSASSKEISRAEHEYMNIYYIVDSKILKIHSEIFSISALVKISIT